MEMLVRSALSAGLAAGLFTAAAGAAVMTPVSSPPLPALASPAVQLRAAVAALPQPAAAAPSIPGPIDIGSAASAGDWIINGYNAIEPWVQYSVELGAWAVGWLPWPIGLAAPQMTIAYSGIQPVTEALVYSTAYLIDGEFDLIGPTITNGVQTGINNFIQGEASWIASYFPPLPPIQFPVLPGAATAPAGVTRTEAPEPRPAAAEPVQSTESEPVEEAVDVTAEPSAPQSIRPAARTPRGASTPESSMATDPVADPPAKARKAGSTKASRGTR